MKVLTLALLIFANSAFAAGVSFQDVMDAYSDRIVISPVEYNGTPVDAYSAFAVCQLAGFTVLLSQVEMVYSGDRYGISSFDGTFSFSLYSSNQDVLAEVECARR